MKKLLTLAALSLAGAASVQAQTVLVASSWVPPTHTLSMAQKEWCDLLAKNTSNRVRCNILPRAVTPPPGTELTTVDAAPTLDRAALERLEAQAEVVFRELGGQAFPK